MIPIQPTGSERVFDLSSAAERFKDSKRFSLFTHESALVIKADPNGNWGFPFDKFPIILIDCKTIEGIWDHEQYEAEPASSFVEEDMEYWLYPASKKPSVLQ